MGIAKHIGADLSSTYAKLEKLTILTRKKSLFDDRPVEIQDLTYIIKQDINSLNKQIAKLQEFTRARQEASQHAKKHSSSVVVSLQSKLANMSKNFKQVLETRTENLKHQKQRREQFSQTPTAVDTLPPRNAQGGALLSASKLQKKQQQGTTSGKGRESFCVDMDGEEGGLSRNE
jgi:syntaxin 5